jgi:uncharacterized protein (TIGR00730 family)
MEQDISKPALDAFEEVHEDTELVPRTPRAPLTVEGYVQQIKETADKLLRDGASRGDVKLLSVALKELRYALTVFANYRQRRKISVFGSARLPLDHPACVQAIDFGRRMAEAGFMVITGAAQGIMEAGHVGAGKEQSIGVNILLPFEQQANAVIANDPKLIHLRYFFTRKLLFVKESDACALFPGGFGTLDEGFEALTLVQTGKSHLFPIVMVDEPGGRYWQRWLDYIKGSLLELKLISPSDLALFKLTDSVEEAVAEVVNFYRVYHSMRYVGRHLVLRLQQAPGPKLLDRLNAEFSDLLHGGTFEVTAALPAEANEPHLAALPRLRFHFVRKDMGRLRMLIDVLNREVPR